MAIRYIGVSPVPKARATDHWSSKGPTEKHRWIAQLRRQKTRPTLMILEKVGPDADPYAREKAWIAHGRKIGWRLTNVSSGGRGANGVPRRADRRSNAERNWLIDPASAVKRAGGSQRDLVEVFRLHGAKVSKQAVSLWVKRGFLPPRRALELRQWFPDWFGVR